MGCLEEFGGWFTSLNIQYLGNDGHWYDVGKFKSTPALPETDIVFFQPPFAQYVLEFPAVKTKGIRVLMDAKVQEHWHKYTKNVSSFISITELGIRRQIQNILFAVFQIYINQTIIRRIFEHLPFCQLVII